MAKCLNEPANVAGLWTMQSAGDAALLSRDPDFYLHPLHLPLGRAGQKMWIAVADGSVADAPWLQAQYGPTRIVPMPAKHILAAIERTFRSEFVDRAVRELAECEPQFSAATTITSAQKKAFAGFFLALALCFLVTPYFAGEVLVVALAITLVVTLLFRVILFFAGLGDAWRQPPAPRIPDGELPIYSILVPLYREANVIPQLITALRAIDYPGIR